MILSSLSSVVVSRIFRALSAKRRAVSLKGLGAPLYISIFWAFCASFRRAHREISSNAASSSFCFPPIDNSFGRFWLSRASGDETYARQTELQYGSMQYVFPLCFRDVGDSHFSVKNSYHHCFWIVNLPRMVNQILNTFLLSCTSKSQYSRWQSTEVK